MRAPIGHIVTTAIKRACLATLLLGPATAGAESIGPEELGQHLLGDSYRQPPSTMGTGWNPAARGYADDPVVVRSLDRSGVEPTFAFPLDTRPSYAEPAVAVVEPRYESLTYTAPSIPISSDAPDERYIDGLEQALVRYRAIASAGGWGTVPVGRHLKPGARDRRVPDIRRRLAVSGDLSQADTNGDVYDGDLERAVRRFQERHGLAGDGVLGARTIEAMNVPVWARISQIETNIARWRSSAPQLSERYVLVNIPAFELEILENDKTAMRMQVITGKPEHPTPVFSDTIDYIVFNPYWNVPASITRNELVDTFATDPAAAEGFEAVRGGKVFDAVDIDWSTYVGRSTVPYQIRQRPGAENALGQVKFMLPNRYNVYLHDTPAHYLFLRSERAFSHGCVRVERPREFAYYLMDDKPDWTPDRVDAALDGDETLEVPLARSVPVHFIYMTAWVDRQGMVQFRNDLYGRDGVAVLTASNE